MPRDLSPHIIVQISGPYLLSLACSREKEKRTEREKEKTRLRQTENRFLIPREMSGAQNALQNYRRVLINT